MSSFSWKSVRPSGLTAGALVIFVGLGAYYYLRTSGYSEYLRQRNLRQLARMSQNIEGRINNFESIVENLEKEKEKRLQAKLQYDVAAQLRLVPTLKIMRRVSEQVQQAQQAQQTLESGEAEPRVTMKVDHQSTGLVLTYRDGKRSEPYRWDLEEAVAPLLENRFFDHVFIADSERHVLVQVGGQSLSLREVPPPWMDPTAEGVDESKDPDGVASAVREARVAGRDYQLFVHPIHLRLRSESDQEGRPHEWMVGGLVDSSRFRTESWALDPTELLLLSIALAFGALAWPFLKIWLMGPRERIAVRDVLFLGLSQVLLAGVLSLCVMDVAYYPSLRDGLDGQLEAVGKELSENFGRELDAALSELEALSEEWSNAGADGRRRAKVLDDRPDSGYPFFEIVFWTNGDGDQIAKWTTQEAVTPFVSVAKRKYFTRVKERTLWARGERRFFIDTIRSVNTGEVLNAISTPCREGWKCEAAVMLTRLRSFNRPLLPPGFSFAVLDDRGAVSAPESSLDENFIVESDRDPALRSVLAARAKDHLTIRYLGRDVRLLSWPLASTPLSLVVFAQKAYLRAINLETLAISFTLFLGYCLIMLLMFAALSYLGFRRRMKWAWPDWERPSKYVLSLTILAIFMVELLVLFFVCPPARLTPYAFLAPFQAIGLALAVLAIGFRGFDGMKVWCGVIVGVATVTLMGAEQSAFRLLPLLAPALSLVAWRYFATHGYLEGGGVALTRRLYLSGSVASLVMIGFLPAMLFFKVVYQDHLELYVKHGQLEIARGLQARARTDPGHEPMLGEDRRRLDVAVAPFFETCARTAEGAWSPCEEPSLEGLQEQIESRHSPLQPQAGVEPHLWRLLPFLSEPSIAMRHMFSPAASDGSWHWSGGWREPAAWLAAEEQPLHLELDDEPRVEVLSWLPHGLINLGGLYVPALASAFGLMLALAWYQGRRVFLLDFEPAGALKTLPIGPGEPIDRHLYIVCPYQHDRAELFCRPDVHLVDLQEVRRLPTPVDLAAAKQVVCVDHFGLRLDEVEWSRSLLDWLEHLAYGDDRILVLLSAREPDSALAEVLKGESESAGESVRGRWVRLLAGFEKIAVSPERGTSDFRAKVQERFAEILGSKALRREAEQSGYPDCLGKLGRRLIEECAGSVPLEKAAERILSREDLHLLSLDSMTEQIREVSEGYYRLLWTNLSSEERLMVAQIADGALVNPHWRQPLRRLLALGLVKRDPELRLFNRSFARFVREEASPEEIAQEESAGGGSTWRDLRQPLFLGLIVLVAFLYATQRQFFQAGLGFISALAVSIPAIFKVMGFLRRPGAGGGGGD